ncbi:MAG TPA: HIT family protein [Acidobacteriota bacterium]|nr:HIT family protein [Acidobacteriota bacterium]
MRTMPECTFCQIVQGQAEACRVFEDEHSVAFLDRRPLFPGHLLLVPRRHHQVLADLPSELLQPLFSTAQLLCRAVERAMQAQGTFVALNNKISQSVPHLHIHVVPRNKKDGLRGFFWPRNPYRDEEHMRSTADRLREAIDRLSGAGNKRDG